jgi:excisionase family DNA binding protein
MNEPKPEDRIALLEEEVSEMRAELARVARRQQFPQYLTAEEVAEMFNLSTRTVHDMVSEKRIPYSKVGSSTRFALAELIEWANKHRDGKQRLRAV